MSKSTGKEEGIENKTKKDYWIECTRHGWRLAINIFVWPEEMTRYVNSKDPSLLVDGKFISGDCPKCQATLTVKNRT